MIRREHWAAVPAVAAIVGCVALTAVVLLAPVGASVDRLRTRLERAIAAGDGPTALLLYQQLAVAKPDEPAVRFGLARTLDRSGRRADAVAVLNTLATGDTGYAPAHLLLAQWAIEARVLGGGADAATLRSARAHARAATADPTTAAEAASALRTLDALTPTP